MTATATTVDAILAATRRVIAERGPDGLTMSAIASAAGVSRPTLYRWFPTKHELLEALTAYEEELFDARLKAVIEAQRSPARRLDAALRCLVTYLDGLMGPDPIGADPAFALESLAETRDQSQIEPACDASIRHRSVAACTSLPSARPQTCSLWVLAGEASPGAC